MNQKVSLDKIHGVPETLLIPLRGRYLETKRADGIINDPKSVEIVDNLNHEFTDELPWDGQIVMAARTEILDEVTHKFLDENPRSVVVNLGCGLDTRVHRVDNGQVLWYELDLCECIEIREKFFQETDRIKFIAKSVLDFSWVAEIPKDRKALFIAEGLFNYFCEEDVKSIVNAIRENFPDSELVFEAYSTLITKSWNKNPQVRNAFSLFKWGVGTGRTMEKWHTGIHFLKDFHYIDRHPKRWGWMRFMRFVPALRKIMKIVHLEFVPQIN
ncbi:MAG: class I SAM-dependent methyltransferase [Phycisphaerae bacterium]|nr:class I SAM-dependent methyltransferase [Phycisphaerae bacterium]